MNENYYDPENEKLAISLLTKNDICFSIDNDNNIVLETYNGNIVTESDLKIILPIAEVSNYYLSIEIIEEKLVIILSPPYTDKVECQWCGEPTNKDDLFEAGGCDLIPKGYMCCEKCINIPKVYPQ